MLDEACQSGNSVSSTARKYGVTSSQLFSWRKLMRFGEGSSAKSDDLDQPKTSHQHLLNEIEHFEKQIAPLVIEKLMRDVRMGDISSYNACNAYGSIVNSFSKLAALKIQVIEKLSAVEQQHNETKLSPEAAAKKRELQEIAERLLVQASKPENAAKFMSKDNRVSV